MVSCFRASYFHPIIFAFCQEEFRESVTVNPLALTCFWIYFSNFPNLNLGGVSKQKISFILRASLWADILDRLWWKADILSLTIWNRLSWDSCPVYMAVGYFWKCKGLSPCRHAKSKNPCQLSQWSCETLTWWRRAGGAEVRHRGVWVTLDNSRPWFPVSGACCR